MERRARPRRPRREDTEAVDDELAVGTFVDPGERDVEPGFAAEAGGAGDGADGELAVGEAAEDEGLGLG
jgi:hypothetical protein